MCVLELGGIGGESRHYFCFTGRGERHTTAVLLFHVRPLDATAQPLRRRRRRNGKKEEEEEEKNRLRHHHHPSCAAMGLKRAGHSLEYSSPPSPVSNCLFLSTTVLFGLGLQAREVK